MEAEMMRCLGLTPPSPSRGVPGAPTGPRSTRGSKATGSNTTPPILKIGYPRIKRTRQIKGDGLISLVWPSIKPRNGNDPEAIADEIGAVLGVNTYQAEWLQLSNGRNCLTLMVEKEELRDLNTRIPLRTGGKAMGWVQKTFPNTPSTPGPAEPSKSTASKPTSPMVEPSPKSDQKKSKGKGRKVRFSPSPAHPNGGCFFCGSQSHTEPDCTQRLLRMASIRQQ